MRIVIEPAVSSVEHGEGLVLITERTGRCYRCSPSAAALWRALADHGDPVQAAVEVAEIYGIDQEKIGADLERLVRTLAAAGLVRIIEEGIRS
ncbi:PqqD family protein [Saccharopolyspora phatthalungensis]|uniref:PqqD family protein n=1 Tax=Saccharopolyspora phatthalungensis TaxID=664693 RepID=A0A840PZB4_9PSEU|nr:PqqD family protein [Saccharopolyspora phatthalungensis]MBB5152561.1 hypothetical protein [Saccharopolyspora phatthalungensis]